MEILETMALQIDDENVDLHGCDETFADVDFDAFGNE
jgi:hypothetical protein